MRLVDLFAGAGGMSLGFQKAGYGMALAVDNWDPAIARYRENFEHPVKKIDLHKVEEVVSEVKKLSPDIIVGGPPCQDFSEAGSRKEGSRAQLTSDYAKIVAKCHPKYFVMENVPRARLSKAYNAARKIFVEAGYGLTEIVLDACYCGVPQRRKRFFCIGARDQKDGFLERILCSRQADVAMSLRDYFGDRLPFEFYYQHPRTYARRGVYSIDEPAVTVRGANRPMPKHYVRHHMDAAAPHRKGIRSLTVDERALIQMFPKEYKWSGVTSIDNQMIGNAVPVGLANFVATALADYDKNPVSMSVPMPFMEWVHAVKGLKKEAARDMLSRYRRARRIAGSRYASDDVLDAQLLKDSQFSKMSQSVKSQLLHAIALHIEYLGYRKVTRSKRDEGGH